MSEQVDYQTVMLPAVSAALQKLRDKRLLKPHQVGPELWQWRPTGMGLAVFSSALPAQQGSGLYQALRGLLEGVCTLDGGVLHLSFVLIGSSSPGRMDITRWQDWQGCPGEAAQ